MNIFKGNRVKNFTIIILAVMCTMLITMGFLFYRKEIQNQKEYFSDIGFYYTDLIKRTLNQQVMLEIDKIQVILKDDSIEQYCKNPSSIVNEHKAGIVLKRVLSGIESYLDIEVISYKQIDDTVSISKTDVKTDDIQLDKTFFETHDYYISNVSRDELSGIQSYTIIAPVYFDKNLVGVVSVSVDLTDFTDLFVSNIRFRETGYIFFANKDGSVIAHPLKESITIPNKEIRDSIKDIVLKARDGKSIIQGSFLGKSKHYYLREIDLSNDLENNGMIVIFTQENEELFRSSEKLLKYLVQLIIIMVVSFAIVLILYGKRFKHLINEDTKFVVEETLSFEVRKQTKELQKIAETDGLTNLYNFDAMHKIISQEVELRKTSGKVLSIMMLDLDFFKEINDTYGHEAGNEILVGISKIFKEKIRDTDVAGRYGGEEFIIMLRDADINKTFEIAERIREAIQKFEFTDEKLHVTISIGLAQLKNEDISEFIKIADEMLYKSKAQGRNKTSF